MVTLLVVAQAIAAILLASVGLFSIFHRRCGGLTASGRILFALGAGILVVAVASAQILNDSAAQQAQQRIEALLHQRFDELSARAMKTPSGPEHPLPTPESESIRIVSPKDGSTVEQRHLIRGEVSDRASRVWVIVHPMDTSSYWVQPEISVRRTGAWTVTAYFGRSGTVDAGKSFEVLAVVDPEVDLREGQFFDKWPDAGLASSAIVVRRK